MTTAEVLGVKDVLSPENEKYADGLKTVEKAFKDALDIFNAPDFISKEGWKKETESSEHDTVYSKHISEGKVFALQCELPGDVETVFWDHWNGIEKVSEWNTNIAFSKVVAKLSDRVEIIHYGNRDILVVKGRDFLASRMYRKLEKGGYMLVGKSFQLPDIPETKDYVRGELKIGAGQFLPKEGNPNVTVIHYLMCMDLKGMIPKAVVNQFMAKMMLTDVVENKKHIAEIMAKK